MKIFYSLNSFLKYQNRSKKFIATIGIFDGVHHGHQKIINAVIRSAKNKNASSLVMTFHPHPVDVLSGRKKKVPLLISLKHRLNLLGRMGIDCVFLLLFDKKLGAMTAHDFIKSILAKLRIVELIVGEDFLFGKDQKGPKTDLSRYAGVYGYKVRIVHTLKQAGKAISSTRIRNLILNGSLKEASRLLSRDPSVLGTVIKGHKRGRIIGFPTANINPHHEAIPPSGVYAVRIKFENKIHKGILNIGMRPTFMNGTAKKREPTIEVHIFNFTRTIYGKDLEIIFVKKIRNEEKFENANLLIDRIKKDCRIARRILY